MLSFLQCLVISLLHRAFLFFPATSHIVLLSPNVLSCRAVARGPSGPRLSPIVSSLQPPKPYIRYDLVSVLRTTVPVQWFLSSIEFIERSMFERRLGTFHPFSSLSEAAESVRAEFLLYVRREHNRSFKDLIYP